MFRRVIFKKGEGREPTNVRSKFLFRILREVNSIFRASRVIKLAKPQKNIFIWFLTSNFSFLPSYDGILLKFRSHFTQKKSKWDLKLVGINSNQGGTQLKIIDKIASEMDSSNRKASTLRTN